MSIEGEGKIGSVISVESLATWPKTVRKEIERE